MITSSCSSGRRKSVKPQRYRTTDEDAEASKRFLQTDPETNVVLLNSLFPIPIESSQLQNVGVDQFAMSNEWDEKYVSSTHHQQQNTSHKTSPPPPYRHPFVSQLENFSSNHRQSILERKQQISNILQHDLAYSSNKITIKQEAIPPAPKQVFQCADVGTQSIQKALQQGDDVPPMHPSIKKALVVSSEDKTKMINEELNQLSKYNAEMFRKGQKFHSIALIKDAVYHYETSQNCNLIIRDSNTLSNNLARSNSSLSSDAVNKALKYKFLRFGCKNGSSHRELKKKLQMKRHTCPFDLTFKLSTDGQYLYVSNYENRHNCDRTMNGTSPYNATQRLWCYGVNVDHRDHFDHANSKIQLPKNSGVLPPPQNNHDEPGERGK